MQTDKPTLFEAPKLFARQPSAGETRAMEAYVGGFGEIDALPIASQAEVGLEVHMPEVQLRGGRHQGRQAYPHGIVPPHVVFVAQNLRMDRIFISR